MTSEVGRHRLRCPDWSAAGQAGVRNGNWPERWAAVTDGRSPPGTAAPTTRDIIASGALSASVRPFLLTKPNDAGVPTTYGRTSGSSVLATVSPYTSGAADVPVAATTALTWSA